MMDATCPNILAADPMQHVLPHELFTIGPLTFTSHLLMVTIAFVAMLVVFPLLARNYPSVPTGGRNLFETLMEFIRNEVARPALHEHTDRFMPFLWTLFFFILFNNLLGMLPLDPMSVLITGKGHVFGTGTAGLSITAGLAVATFVFWNVSGCVEQYKHQREKGRGVVAAVPMAGVLYLHSFVPHIPGVLGLILYVPFLLLELILSLVKPFALAIRLFANMMAGHVVLASLLAMAPVIVSVGSGTIAGASLLGCVAISCLELFVAFLQAYVFVFLTCLFLGSAVSPDH